MAILRHSNTRDKNLIIQEFDPFTNPKAYDGMLIGNDLDSVISACFLKERFGWDVLGMYDYKNLWFSNRCGDFIEMVKTNRIVAIDLDVYHESLYSLGHHILERSNNDLLPKHVRTLNPNFIRGINVNNFKRKYPLGTIHFLLWLFDVKDLSRECALTVWLADSAFINGQSHKFGGNVNEWIENYLDLDMFKQMACEVDTQTFEEELSSGVLKTLCESELCKPSGQVMSRHLKLSGYQCQWQEPNQQHRQVQELFDTVSKLTGWPAPKIPSGFNLISGDRHKISIEEIVKQHKTLDGFLQDEKVFSYVFPYKDSVNYTTNIF